MSHEPLVSEPVESRHRCELIDVTARLQRLVDEKGLHSGIVIVHVPHTTAAVTINENADPDVQHDLLKKLETLIPRREPFYQHVEGNSDSHLKASLIGNSVTLLVEGGRLVLGTWQAVYFCEFDGPRQRRMLMKLAEL